MLLRMLASPAARASLREIGWGISSPLTCFTRISSRPRSALRIFSALTIARQASSSGADRSFWPIILRFIKFLNSKNVSAPTSTWASSSYAGPARAFLCAILASSASCAVPLVPVTFLRPIKVSSLCLTRLFNPRTASAAPWRKSPTSWPAIRVVDAASAASSGVRTAIRSSWLKCFSKWSKVRNHISSSLRVSRSILLPASSISSVLLRRISLICCFQSTGRDLLSCEIIFVFVASSAAWARPLGCARPRGRPMASPILLAPCTIPAIGPVALVCSSPPVAGVAPPILARVASEDGAPVVCPRSNAAVRLGTLLFTVSAPLRSTNPPNCAVAGMAPPNPPPKAAPHAAPFFFWPTGASPAP